jgi:peptidoglycan hydrolase-like protein with peptidoglycan-binding domain
MTKMNLIIPICVTIVSGCALFDGAEMESGKPVVSVPVVDKDNASQETDVKTQQPVVMAAPTRVPRTLSRDDIRRLQMRLREIGFDPGPVDGIAGSRTKRAFEKLQSGCASAAPVLEKFSFTRTATTGGVPPNRTETLALQTQLRSAGFDPGPADGIFGNRTKSALSQLQTGCSVAKEFDGSLDDGVRMVNNPPSAAAPTASAVASVQNQRAEAEQARAVSAANGSQEEIRILQLRLRDAGFDPGPFDGVMGPRTRLALQQYEASQSGNKIKTSLQTNTISGQY